jgi:uncharacterized protein YecT (DUF1311 family)
MRKKAKMLVGVTAGAVMLAAPLLLPTSPARAQSTAEMVSEADARFKRADRRLNAAYQKLLARADATGKAKLRKAQRAWLAFRDAECEWAADEMRGGSGAAPIYAGVRARLTEERAADLERNVRSWAGR